MQTTEIRPAPGGAAESGFLRGTNQSGMRDHNERLVLSLLRRHGGLAKTDIARLTQLSVQTISVIMRALEADGLLLRREPVRGRVGQPSVPMALNPDGAFFFGLKIGRRSAELVLIDFLGNIRAMRQLSYRYPTPRETTAFALDDVAAIRSALPPEQDRRIAGLGIAIPFELWNWADTVGAPHEAMDAWRGADIKADIQSRHDFPVYLQNDATAACGAELVFGQSGGLSDFLYFYIGAFVGGGVVLNGALHAGRTGNAGALGSMPVPGPGGKPVQLIDAASLATLEKSLAARGIDASFLWQKPADWDWLGSDLDLWIATAANALAHAIVSASAVIDFEAAVIDGWMPRTVRARLAEAVRAAFGQIDTAGIALPHLREGTVGVDARSLGAASLPLCERFLVGAPLAAAT
ncbi:MarR family transcriptional regulator [Pseudaminobacter salicylatoxidans]|uniref:MarR family transcriptional regulator n=2 Tax=Pseudaminobacter salicylatoxidans TaxID=93369 RepID=A0A316CBE8_PSESE|nr:MarR family transcriptional regulator [Pseudaminobacter salicylatoxidans]